MAFFGGHTTYHRPLCLHCLGIIFRIFLLVRADIGSARCQIAIISSSKEKGSLTPAIPLQSLHSETESSNRSAGLPGDPEKATHSGNGRRSSVSDSQASDFSIWSNTGDIAEQLASEEDPLRIRLRKSEDDGGQEPQSRTKRVHYSDETYMKGELEKEAIDIPNITRRRVSRAHCILAIMMSPNDMSTARTRGLVGKPLL